MIRCTRYRAVVVPGGLEVQLDTSGTSAGATNARQHAGTAAAGRLARFRTKRPTTP